MFSHLEAGEHDAALFRQLADRVVELIDQGVLKPGDRLPPQREIAREAKVNLGTVTRAFAELQEGGYVESRPGRGSIISAGVRRHDFRSASEDLSGFIDLSVSRPATDAWLRVSASLLSELPRDVRFAQTADFHPAQGPAWARDAVADWLAPMVGHRDPERLILTNGAQHGLACALGAIAQPGGAVLTDPITYQGVAALCASLSLRLMPVEMDEGGMLPDALDRACRQARPCAVFLTPTLHNPLTLTLSAERRSALAEVARRHGTIIIEDDVYRPLMPDAPAPILSGHDDMTVYLTSLSKCAAPGGRFGVVFAPPHLAVDIATMLRVNCWSTPPMTALIVTQMIEKRHLNAIIDEQRMELGLRYQALSPFFRTGELDGASGAPHAWLRLPEPWRGEAFVRAARQAGVGLLPGAAFAVSRDAPPPDAARINLSAARSVDQLEQAARILRRLMDMSPALAETTV